MHIAEQNTNCTRVRSRNAAGQAATTHNQWMMLVTKKNHQILITL